MMTGMAWAKSPMLPRLKLRDHSGTILTIDIIEIMYNLFIKNVKSSISH